MASRRALSIWLLVCALGVALSFAQARVAGGGQRNSRTTAMLAIFLGDDYSNLGDPMPTLSAARALRGDAHARIYDPEHVESSFLYPPIAALFYAPLAAQPGSLARETIIVVSHVLWIAIGFVVLALMRAGGALALREVALAGAALATFYPLLRALALNQATLFVTVAIGLAWLALEHGMEIAAGVLFALAVAIKPHLVLALPLLGWHARRLAIATLATCAALAALSIVYAGWQNHVDYVTKLLPALARGYASFEEQSFHGLANRALGNGDPATFTPAPPSRAASLLSLGASAITYALALLAVYRARRVAGAASFVFGLAWLAATLASPLAWEHHYGPSIFLFAIAYRAYANDTAPRRALPLFAAAYVLLASYFAVRTLHGAWLVLASTTLFGALLLAAAVGVVLVQKRAAAA